MLQPTAKLPHLLSLYLVLLLIYFSSSISAKTTIHFFGHTSCNADTSLWPPFTGNAEEAGTCQTAPAEAIALYIDGLDSGCTSKSGTAIPAVLGSEVTQWTN